MSMLHKAIHTVIALLFFLTLTLLFGPSLAPDARAQDVPEINLDYQRFTLDNGLTVIVHEDRKAPIVAVSIWYHVGSKNEPEGKTGFAHLFEHLMFNGTENYDGEWFEPLQQVGATSMNGTTWLDRTNYFQNVPTPALDLALWMESDRMGHLLGAVSQEKLDNQRGVVQNEKRQGDNQPYGRVNYNLYEGLFPEGHPYRHSTIGSMEDLNAASLDDVQQWFRDYYGPNNAVLVLAGDIDLGTAREKVNRFFGDIPAGPEVDAIDAMIPVRLHNTSEVQFDEVPAVLANRAWAVPGRSTRDKALLDIAAGILSTGNNSRLYRDLVYDRQVASSVNGSVTPFELASVFDLSVNLNPGIAPAVANGSMDRVFADFLAQGPTREEMERVVTRLNAGIIRGLEVVGGFSGKAAILAEGELYADDPTFIKTYLEWINTATAEDVRDAARQWLGDGWHQVDVVPNRSYSVSGGGVDRSTGLPDIPSESPALSFPEIRTATLSNGIEVVLAERHTMPLVEMSIQFDAGYAADAGGKPGLSSFVMNMLQQGTETRGALELSAEEERLGAHIGAGSNLDESFVMLSALKSNLQDSLALWADVIQNPAFDQEEIDRLRVRWLSAIEREKSDPEALVRRLMPAVIYGAGHAYSVPGSGTGTVASINSLNRDDLVNFSETWLRPDNARIFITGDTTLEEITPLLERAFRRWESPGTPLPVKQTSQVAMSDDVRVILIDKPGSPQSMIIGAHLAPPPDTPEEVALNAVNRIVGGVFTSRTNMNLREDKGWSYGVRSGLLEASGQRTFMIRAPVQSDRTGDSLAELVNDLQAVRNERPIQAGELSDTVAGVTRGLPGSFETSDSVLSSLISSSRYGRPLDYAATLGDRYEALSLPEVREAAGDLIHPDSMTWMIVGDLATIRSQVEELGLAPTEVWDEEGNPVE